MDHPVQISSEDLQRTRFARGAMAPRGKLYYPTHIPDLPDLRPLIVKGIRETCFTMLYTPVPLIGVRGVRYVAGQLRSWPKKLGTEQAARYLGQLIRMQEEIGTGGAGFRFIFSSFLQEAAAHLQQEWLMDLSHEVTAVGDRLREFALLGPNGAGKTTTLNICYGLLPATSGIIRLQGKTIHQQHRRWRRQIGLVPQDIALYPTLTARHCCFWTNPRWVWMCNRGR